MAVTQVTASSTSVRSMPAFGGLRSSPVRESSVTPLSQQFPSLKSSRRLVIKASTTVAPKVFDVLPSSQFTTLEPLGNRVLVKIKDAEEMTPEGLLLPVSARAKPLGGEIVSVGEGTTFGINKDNNGLKTGSQIVYSNKRGTELEFNGSSHLILEEDDIVGILETGDVKDLKPLEDRVLIKVDEAEEKTHVGLFLTEATKDRRRGLGTVVAVGPGSPDGEGNSQQLSVYPGNNVIYSKYAGNDYKSADGSDYVVVKASDLLAVLS